MVAMYAVNFRRAFVMAIGARTQQLHPVPISSAAACHPTALIGVPARSGRGHFQWTAE